MVRQSNTTGNLRMAVMRELPVGQSALSRCLAKGVTHRVTAERDVVVTLR